MATAQTKAAETAKDHTIGGIFSRWTNNDKGHPFGTHVMLPHPTKHSMSSRIAHSVTRGRARLKPMMVKHTVKHQDLDLRHGMIGSSEARIVAVPHHLTTHPKRKGHHVVHYTLHAVVNGQSHPILGGKPMTPKRANKVVKFMKAHKHLQRSTGNHSLPAGEPTDDFQDLD